MKTNYYFALYSYASKMMKKERFDSMTDAVVAILITLMVLEIKIPQLTIDNLPDIIVHVCVYALSFVTIAIGWINHHLLFSELEKVTIDIIWINFGFLFALSLLPLATAPLGEHFFEASSHMLYGFAGMMISLFFTLMFSAVHRETRKDKKTVREANIRNWSSVALYTISIPLSLVSIYMSALIFISFNVFYFFQSRKNLKDA